MHRKTVVDYLVHGLGTFADQEPGDMGCGSSGRGRRSSTGVTRDEKEPFNMTSTQTRLSTSSKTSEW